MHKPEEYGVSVRLVQEDGIDMYEARVTELPDVRAYGDSYAEAYIDAIEVIRTTQQIFAEKGRPFPAVELPEDDFSGRVTMRMSRSLHRAVHTRAQSDSVSLNQWIVECVASRVGGAASHKSVFVAMPKMNKNLDAVTLQIEPARYLDSFANGSSIIVAAESTCAHFGKMGYLRSPSNFPLATTEGKHHG